MLTLTRRHRESIMIGDDIEIKILKIDTRNGIAELQIGCAAPQEVKILRKELWDKERGQE